ncbi:MAG: arylesterase [Gammaproteobacteria bacterium]|nr:arylesterase [Gammaproteobacteria bacterium]
MLRIFLLGIITTCAPLAVAQNITVLVLGDSISAAYGLSQEQGWVTLLQARLSDRDPSYRVVNASISGDTSSGGLQRLPQALVTHDPDIVIIELGGNDGLRGQSLKNLRQNLEEMTRLSQAAGAKVLLLGMQIPSNYGPAYTERFSAAFTRVAKDTGAALMPFFLEPIGKDRTHFQSDGIHPSAAAQPLLLDGMWPYLEALL